MELCQILTQTNMQAHSTTCMALYTISTLSRLKGCLFFIQAGPHLNTNIRYMPRMKAPWYGFATRNHDFVLGSGKRQRVHKDDQRTLTANIIGFLILNLRCLTGKLSFCWPIYFLTRRHIIICPPFYLPLHFWILCSDRQNHPASSN